MKPSGKRRQYAPQRGDVVWLTFDPQAGHEQSGRRPAVVLSPREYNEHTDLAIFCPITTQVKGYPFEVQLPANMQIRGAVLADQVRSVDWRARKAEHIVVLPTTTMDEILGKLDTLLAR